MNARGRLVLFGLACAPMAWAGPSAQLPAGVAAFRSLLAPTVNLFRDFDGSFWLEQGIGQGRYARFQLATPMGTKTKGRSPIQLAVVDIATSMAAFPPRPERFMGDWAAKARTGAYKGRYWSSTTVGARARFDIGAGASRLGLRGPTDYEGGLAKVSILDPLGRRLNDSQGRAVVANGLPTAQDMVNLGLAPSTILVANGGTFLPTDRVLDCYTGRPNPDRLAPIYDGETLPACRLDIVVARQKSKSSLGVRVHVAGLMLGDGNMALVHARTTMAPVRIVNRAQSAFESVGGVLLEGGSGWTFVGKSHGYEDELSVDTFVDNVRTQLLPGERRSGSRVSVVVGSRLLHPDTFGLAEPAIANMVTTYDVRGFLGLSVRTSTTYLRNMMIGPYYAAMFPVMGNFANRASMADVSGDVDLTVSDGAMTVKAKTDFVAQWDASGNRLAAGLWVPSMQTQSFGYAYSAPNYVAVRRFTGGLNKVYFSVSGSSGTAMPVAAGAVHDFTAWYYVGRFDDATGTFSKGSIVY